MKVRYLPLKDIPEKGKGLVVIENILKSTQILARQPVVTTPEGRWDAERLKIHIPNKSSASVSANDNPFSLFTTFIHTRILLSRIFVSFGQKAFPSRPTESKGGLP